MNERIKELAEQIASFHNGQLNLTGNEQVEQFALLIVRICAEIAYKAEPYMADDLIKKHFGIRD
jgi:hypothetical protein